jgi:glucose-6-phosphatase
MITLVVLLTCAEHVEEGRRRRGVWFRRLLWLGVASIGLSRLLISSHFLHQVLCGLLFGLAIHRATSRPLLSLLAPSPGPRQGWRLLLAPAMAGLALALFRLWTWLGMDPGFSIPLARRYCAQSQWVKLSTTPLFSLMRATGSVVGVAVITKLQPHSLSGTVRSVAGVATSFILIGCLELVPMATDITVFYVQALCMCALVPVIVGGVSHFMSHR